MRDNTDIAAGTQRFRDAVRAFTPPSQVRHARADSDERRDDRSAAKRTSLRLIREPLANVRVAVSTATVVVFRENEPQFSVRTITSAMLAHALPGSEHDPSALYRFASDRRDGRQSAAATSLPTNADMLKDIPGCAFNRTTGAAAVWDES